MGEVVIGVDPHKRSNTVAGAGEPVPDLVAAGGLDGAVPVQPAK